jgi:hypothetical protein
MASYKLIIAKLSNIIFSVSSFCQSVRRLAHPPPSPPPAPPYHRPTPDMLHLSLSLSLSLYLSIYLSGTVYLSLPLSLSFLRGCRDGIYIVWVRANSNDSCRHTRDNQLPAPKLYYLIRSTILIITRISGFVAFHSLFIS